MSAQVTCWHGQVQTPPGARQRFTTRIEDAGGIVRGCEEGAAGWAAEVYDAAGRLRYASIGHRRIADAHAAAMRWIEQETALTGGR